MRHQEELEQLFEDVKTIASISKLECETVFTCGNWIIAAKHFCNTQGAKINGAPVRVSAKEKRITIILENFNNISYYEVKLFFILWCYFRYYENTHKIFYNTEVAKDMSADFDTLSFMNKKGVFNESFKSSLFFDAIREPLLIISDISHQQAIRSKKIFKYFYSLKEQLSTYRRILNYITKFNNKKF